MSHLSALYRYPVKSTAVESLAQAEVDALGLVGDRRWMVVDADTGRFLTLRQLAQMNHIEARWLAADRLRLSAPGRTPLEVAVPDATGEQLGVTIWRDTLQAPVAAEADAWLSDFLGRRCRLVYIAESHARQINTDFAEPGQKVHFADGFPLLLTSEASLADLVERVGKPLEMLRFRPNLVVEGTAAYAEDGWKRLRIGTVDFAVACPCSRCIVITQDPVTGEKDLDRQPLTALREYRFQDNRMLFGMNVIPLGRGVIEAGMPVEVLE